MSGEIFFNKRKSWLIILYYLPILFDILSNRSFFFVPTCYFKCIYTLVILNFVLLLCLSSNSYVIIANTFIKNFFKNEVEIYKIALQAIFILGFHWPAYCLKIKAAYYNYVRQLFQRRSCWSVFVEWKLCTFWTLLWFCLSSLITLLS